MTIRIILLFILVFLFMVGCTKDTSPTGADDPDPNGEEELLRAFKADEGAGVVKVMTRNVYIGTDVDIILDADSVNTIPILVAGAYQLLLATDFATRAEALASEIERSNPHLIGLQEMTKYYIQSPGDFVVGGQVPATDKFLDFFDVLMAALEDKGLDYELVAIIKNADVELPMLTTLEPTFDDIRIEDHDAILARGDVITSNVMAVPYDSFLVVDADLGLFIPRGFVSVDAQVGEINLVFANTHLEAASLDDGLRLTQAEQLLNSFINSEEHVVIVGDFNSQAPSGVTYQYVLSEGYTDVWTENTLTYNQNGYTFGHSSDLRNDAPSMFERIDFIFVGSPSNATIGEGFVLGDETRDKTSTGLWPSDHSGVVAKLTFSLPMKIVANN